MRSLAEKHGISASTAQNWVKGIEKTLAPLIHKAVLLKQELATLNVHELENVQSIVDEKIRDLIFIRESSLLVANAAVKKVREEDCTMQDLKHAQDVIGKGKDNIYDKMIAAAQVNANPNSLTDVLREHGRLFEP